MHPSHDSDPPTTSIAQHPSTPSISLTSSSQTSQSPFSSNSPFTTVHRLMHLSNPSGPPSTFEQFTAGPRVESSVHTSHASPLNVAAVHEHETPPVSNSHPAVTLTELASTSESQGYSKSQVSCKGHVMTEDTAQHTSTSTKGTVVHTRQSPSTTVPPKISHKPAAETPALVSVSSTVVERCLLFQLAFSSVVGQCNRSDMCFVPPSSPSTAHSEVCSMA
mmetsp:Transcript_10968/g.12538  ORF Transcript_10968/g.12538 Transcript_10968/m.12538 type:complete len:220 (+) Transcript_10968:908-1567(+)